MSDRRVESQDGGPELYRTRLIQLQDGREVLGWDFARRAGDKAPVAVTGPRAVPCPRCEAAAGDKCAEGAVRIDRFGRVLTMPPAKDSISSGDAASHFERVAAMNKELRRLRAEAEK